MDEAELFAVAREAAEACDAEGIGDGGYEVRKR